LDSRGETRRSPGNVDVPEIGDEVAAARALRRLADRLQGVASEDIEAIEGHEVHLRP
jgi:Rv2632c-like